MNAHANGQRILVAEDELEIQAYLELALKYLGYSVELVQDGEEALDLMRSRSTEFAALLLDLIIPRRDGMQVLKEVRHMAPGLPVIVISGAGSSVNIVTAMKCGATDFLCKPIGHDELAEALHKALQADSIAEASPTPFEPVSARTQALFGSSRQMQEIQSLVRHVGSSEAPVLIQGETGSGKEIIARELHAHSPRAGRCFFKLNCAALPSELVESELFGYERGAFTGAYQKRMGMFQAAEGGTILLDEIGDMDVRLQAKLLQVLQDREFYRVGGNETIKVNVRVIAATHRDLQLAMANGSFRQDLYYRLNVINLVVPPLRDRKEEIIPLGQYLLKKHLPDSAAVSLPGELREAMVAYHWPGNVRELENVMQKLIVLRDPKRIAKELRVLAVSRPAMSAPRAAAVADASSGMPAAVSQRAPISEQPLKAKEREADAGLAAAVPDAAPILQQVVKAKETAEAEAILAALNSTRWNRKKAAALLQMDYKALLYRIKKLGVKDNVMDFGPMSVRIEVRPSSAAAPGSR